MGSREKGSLYHYGLDCLEKSFILIRKKRKERGGGGGGKVQSPERGVGSVFLLPVLNSQGNKCRGLQIS